MHGLFVGEDLTVIQKIDSRKISVVIQGPLVHRTKNGHNISKTIQSLKTHLPHAEIVLSTWIGQRVPALDGVKVVLSADPGALVSDLGLVNNVNRQLVSTLAGLDASTRPYVLKFRSDFLMADDSIAVILERDSSKHETSQIFLERVTTTNLYVTNHYEYPQLFHASDLVQFGTRGDILDYWQQPLFTPEQAFLNHSELSNYFEKVVFHGGIKLVPEQLLTLGWLKKHQYNLNVKSRHFGNEDLLRTWEHVLVNNFHVIDHQNSGIVFPSRFTKDQLMAKYNFTAESIWSLRRDLDNGSHIPNLNKYVRARYKVLITFTPSHLADVAAANLSQKYPRVHRALRPLWFPIKKFFKL